MNLPISEQAKLFNRCAGNYARHRPSYSGEAITGMIRECGLPPGAKVCDLGSGTGILSELLARRGLKVAAAEPLLRMRAIAKARQRATGLDISILRGSAGHIPLRDGSVSAVVCGQSFHWFAHQRALEEIHRVLMPRGWLAVMWNNRMAERQEWIASMESLFRKYNPDYRTDYRQRDWKAAINQGRYFRCAERREFEFVQLVSIPAVLGLISSFSYVQVIPGRERQLLKREVRKILADRFGHAPGRTIPLPMVTELYLARRGEKKS